MRERTRKLLGPMIDGAGGRLKIEREMPHRIQRISLCNSDKKIRVVYTKMPFHGIVMPGQAQYLNSAPTTINIHVTVESSVKQDIAGLCRSTPRETCLGKASRQHDRGVALQVTVAWAIRASDQSFEAGCNRSVVMRSEHVISLACLRLSPQQPRTS